MKNIQHFRIFLLAILLSLTVQSALKQEKLSPFLKKYFSSSKPSFFVSIQSNPDLAIINNPVFRQWFGLRVFPTTNSQSQKIKTDQILDLNFALGNSSNNIHTASNGAMSLTITLEDLCMNYFVKKPAFLLIEDDELLFTTVKSAFWQNYDCIPEFLILKDSADITAYLQGIKMEKKESIEGYSIYIYIDSVQHYEQLSKIYANQPRKANSFEEMSAMDDVIGLIRQKHPSEAGKVPGQLLTIFDINTKIVSISNILQQAASNNKNKYLLLRGYSSRKNLIFIDRPLQSYTLQTRIIKNTQILNITLIGQSPFPYVLVSYSPFEHANIFEEELKKIRCQEYQIDEQVYVNIRGGTGGVSAQIKDGNYVDRSEQIQGRNPHYFDEIPPQIQLIPQKEITPNEQQLQYPTKIDDKIKNSDIVRQQDKKGKQAQPQQSPVQPLRIILIFTITAGIVFLGLCIIRLRNKRIVQDTLKKKTKIKKIEAAYEEVSISQLEGTELK